MSREEILSKVLEMVAMSYKKDASEVTLETSFKDDLKGASVQMVALVSEIENELDTDPLEIPTAAACDTMKELIDLVEENL